MNTIGNHHEWEIGDFDQLRQPISPKFFYREYVSKSLPCIFRNEIEETDLYLEFKDAIKNKTLDKFL